MILYYYGYDCYWYNEKTIRNNRSYIFRSTSTTYVPINTIKKEIMSSAVITISSKSSPSEAADMMLQDNVRHLPVVDNGMRTDPLVGLLRFTSQDTRMTMLW
jgi:CBS domain-containing protein